VILSTPTGSGKSLVAAGAHFAAVARDQVTFYTAPIKALVSEKFFALCDTFAPENVGMMTGDASVNSAAPIICCTAARWRSAAAAIAAALSWFENPGARCANSNWTCRAASSSSTRTLLLSAVLLTNFME